MSLDADGIYKKIIESAKKWVAADEEARKLVKLEKVILAEITNRQPAESMSERKSLALASPEYRLHLDMMIAKKSEANMALAEYKAAQSLSELRRSEESTRRAEMGMR